MPATPPVADPLDTQRLKQAFVATYNSQSYQHAWEAIEDFEKVLEASAKRPDAKSSAISNAVGLPRGRIRAWVDGDGMPDAYRGLQRLQAREWLPDSWESRTIQGLNGAMAGIFAGGSVSQTTYAPLWALDGAEERSILDAVADRLDAQLVERRDEPLEVSLAEDATVFGRLLVALGAPLGDKSPNVVRSLPPYLDAAPLPLRRDFARVYVTFRGTPTAKGDGIQITEKRTDAYREDLAALFRGVVPGEDGVRATAWPIRLYGDAKVDLSTPPSFLR